MKSNWKNHIYPTSLSVYKGSLGQGLGLSDSLRGVASTTCEEVHIDETEKNFYIRDVGSNEKMSTICDRILLFVVGKIIFPKNFISKSVIEWRDGKLLVFILAFM